MMNIERLKAAFENQQKQIEDQDLKIQGSMIKKSKLNEEIEELKKELSEKSKESEGL